MGRMKDQLKKDTDTQGNWEKEIPTIWLEKSIRCEVGHRLHNHPGKCSNLHGHSWEFVLRVQVAVISESTGYGVDLGELGEILKEFKRSIDHKTLLWKEDPLWDVICSIDPEGIYRFGCMGVDYPPSCEMIAQVLREIALQWDFRSGQIVDAAVRVRETATGGCEVL